ncbi:MAG: hypothetical protein R3B39_01975 [Candidatus Paceibacterota bacterium]
MEITLSSEFGSSSGSEDGEFNGPYDISIGYQVIYMLRIQIITVFKNLIQMEIIDHNSVLVVQPVMENSVLRGVWILILWETCML